MSSNCCVGVTSGDWQWISLTNASKTFAPLDVSGDMSCPHRNMKRSLLASIERPAGLVLGPGRWLFDFTCTSKTLHLSRCETDRPWAGNHRQLNLVQMDPGSDSGYRCGKHRGSQHQLYRDVQPEEHQPAHQHRSHCLAGLGYLLLRIGSNKMITIRIEPSCMTRYHICGLNKSRLTSRYLER